MNQIPPKPFPTKSVLMPRSTLAEWRHVPETNKIASAMDLAKFDINEVVAGRASIAYITGPPGVGKTHSINEAVAEWRANGLEPIRCQPASKTELLSQFDKSEGITPIIMEEMDLLFRSTPIMEVFKLATDLHGSRILEKPFEGKTKIISLKAPIIVTANINIKSLERTFQDQAKALFDRQQPTTIPYNVEEQWEWTAYLALTTQILTQVTTPKMQHGISWQVFDATLDWFTDNIWNIEHVSPRVLKNVAEIISRNSLSFDMTDRQKQLNLARLCRTSRMPKPTPPKVKWSDLRREYISHQKNIGTVEANAASLVAA